MQPNNLRDAIVRILKSSGETAGTGFIVSTHLIATCAHVIKFAGAEPGSVVHCILLANGKELKASVTKQYWRNPSCEDIALLQVNESFPVNITLKLGSSANIKDHSFYSYGFPASISREIQIRGTLIGETADRSRIELRSRDIVEGVSGAPVFDQQTQRVVGIVVERTDPEIKKEEQKIKLIKGHEGFSGFIPIITPTGRLEDVAYAIPSHVLSTICPELTIQNICPYKGLFAFTELDANFFYGRNKLVSKLIEQLRSSPRCLIVVGSSGSGKSSLVQAGLLPRLQQGDIAGWENCNISKSRPTSDPKQVLLKALVMVNTDGKSFAETPYPIDSSLDFWTNIYQLLQLKSLHNLLFIDQFEELFSLCSLETQKDFTHGLLSLLESDLSITIILAIRADFYSQLLDSCLGGQPKIDVLRMEEEELRAAITQPAEKVGLRLEPGLPDLIIRDLENTKNPLPLLEFTLEQLWNSEHLNNYLTCHCYAEKGRVTGAIALWANNTYFSLNEAEQKLARQIFIHLIRCGSTDIPDTRRKCSISELLFKNEENANIYNLVMKLADNRLLVTDSDEKTDKATVEIIHETLIQQWNLLRRWIDENRENLIQKDRLETAAKSWKDKNNSKDYLLRGKPLTEAKDFWRGQSKNVGLSELAVNFIQGSLKQRQNDYCRAASILLIPTFISLCVVLPYLRQEKYDRAWSTIRSGGAGTKEALEVLFEGCEARITLGDIVHLLIGRFIFGECPYSQSIDLHDANLAGANLAGAWLLDANLYNSELAYSDLSRAGLVAADLREANLVGVDLRNANLTIAQLNNASLRGADLRNATLNKVNLIGANLTVVNLQNADLKGALYDVETRFPEGFDPSSHQMHLIGPSSNLRGADLRGADLPNVNLSNADLSSTDFDNTDLNRANLVDANLDNTDLSGSRNLTVEQVKAARNWERAIYSKAFCQELQLQECKTRQKPY